MADRLCSIEGCEKRHMARGWCNTHYWHWWRNGDPLGGRFYPIEIVHGTANAYMNRGCRCQSCRDAIAVYTRERNHRLGLSRPVAIYNAERHAAALARDNHGTESRYNRHGCRCDHCRAASAAARRRRRRAAA